MHFTLRYENEGKTAMKECKRVMKDIIARLSGVGRLPKIGVRKT